MITEKSPGTWQELQEWTAQILRECGWEAETEVKIKSVRGSSKIDVFATETVQGRKYKTLVECKNWLAAVPQNVVHGFRTLMGDVGANSGYIISKSGFQKGAYEAAANTNINLLSWQEFQDAFEDQWYSACLKQRVGNELDGLCSYLEPIPAMAHWDKFLEEGDIARLVEMYRQHQPLGALIMAMHPVSSMLPKTNHKVTLPIGERGAEHGVLPASLTERVGYREFLDELVKHSMPILTEFRSYRDLAFKRKAALVSEKNDPSPEGADPI